ncbi:MAG: NHL repeat-containing protein [Gemmatimonadota bacterium]
MSVARSLLAIALLAFPKSALGQIPWPAGKSATAKAARPARASTLSLSAATTVTEAEPNDLVSQAQHVTLGDIAGGTISVTDDVDSYAIDLVAGSKIELDVLASRAGSPLDPTLTLLGPDGVTVLAFNDDYLSPDSHIELFITSTGRYFIQVQGFSGVGSPTSTYALSFGSVPEGPGDPPTRYTERLGSPMGIAAGPAGELYVTDIGAQRLVRVAPTGEVTELGTFPGEFPVGVVVDGFGDVLVSTVNTAFSAGRILRFRGGTVSTFTAALQSGATMTVGPDGDVWVIDPVARALRRFDPLGGPKATVNLASLTHFAFDMGLAFSPAGELFLTDGFATIYRISDGVPQIAFQTDPFLNGLAFDKDGFLYVANGSRGRVTLLDPDLHVVEDPFARSYLSGSTQLAFLRGADGAMTPRLLADNAGLGSTASDVSGIIEMNPARIRAEGFRIGIDFLPVANATLNDGVVGADYADELRLTVSPASGRVTWSLASGALPPGITLSPDGHLTGIPAQAGRFTFAVRADADEGFALKSFAVIVTIPTVSVDDAAADLLGGAPLDLTRRRFLDLQGNRNGNFDLGDFRAFLRANGQLPAPAGKEQP